MIGVSEGAHEGHQELMDAKKKSAREENDRQSSWRARELTQISEGALGVWAWITWGEGRVGKRCGGIDGAQVGQSSLGESVHWPRGRVKAGDKT